MIGASELSHPAPHFTEEENEAQRGQKTSQWSSWDSDLSLLTPSSLAFPITFHQLPSRVGFSDLEDLKLGFVSALLMYSRVVPSPVQTPSCSPPVGASGLCSPSQTGRWRKRGSLGAGQTNPSSPCLKGLCPEAGRGVWGERELCAACPHSVLQPHRGQG